jgi:hypothetical protein
VWQRVSFALSVSIIWAASIGGMYDGKEIDIQESDEKQSSEEEIQIFLDKRCAVVTLAAKTP